MWKVRFVADRFRQTSYWRDVPSSNSGWGALRKCLQQLYMSVWTTISIFLGSHQYYSQSLGHAKLSLQFGELHSLNSLHSGFQLVVSHPYVITVTILGCPLAVPVPRSTHLTPLLSKPIPSAHINLHKKNSHPNNPSHMPSPPHLAIYSSLYCFVGQ